MFRLSLVLIGCACTVPAAVAADRITIRPADSVGRIVVTGDIEDYNDEFLNLRASGGSLQTYPAGVISAVETYRAPTHQTGIERYRRGDIAAAIADFQQALQREQRKWMRREILSWIVRCHQRQGDRDAAAARFVEIVAEEPHTRFWNVAPLTWMASTPSERLQVSGKHWVTAPTEAVRLVGASVLLGAPQTRLTGIAELHKLARSQDRYVGALAQAQIWNATLGTNITSVEELARWERDIGRMPESIRGGPWFALGQARVHRNEPEEAAAAFLRVLIVHDADELLAARAGLEAGLALERINRDDESRTVLQEVVDRFPWSDAAREASQHLAAPTASPSNPPTSPPAVVPPPSAR
jgi:tetratricopeptide (TPR) repeat protein